MVIVPMITLIQVLAVIALVAVLAGIIFLLNNLTKLVNGTVARPGVPGAGTGGGTGAAPAVSSAQKAYDLAMDLAAERRVPTAQECKDLAGWRDDMVSAGVPQVTVARVNKMLTNLCDA